MERSKFFEIVTIIALTTSIFGLIIGYATFKLGQNTNQAENNNSNENVTNIDENTKDVSETKFVYTINNSNSQTQINQPIPLVVEQYKTAGAVRNYFENRPYYLKHKLEKDKIKESFIEFIVSDDMAIANPGMIAGKYALKGGDSAAYELNKRILKKAYGEGKCTQTATNINCNVYGLSVSANIYGDITAGSDIWICSVSGNGSSYCDNLYGLTD